MMDLADVTRELTVAVIAKIEIPEEEDAAEWALGIYKVIWVELQKTPASQDALRTAAAVIRKDKVDLGDEPALTAARIYKRIQEELP